MGDRVAVIRKGELQQPILQGSHLYPKDLAGFIGSPSMNFVYANVKVSPEHNFKLYEDAIKCNR